MTGIVNSTGARSGIIGTTVGTPVSGVNAADIGSGVLPVGVTGGSGLTALGTVISGILGAGVSLKVHVLDGFTINTGVQAAGYNIGGTTASTHLTIASADNPNGAIFLVIGGGGRCMTYPDTAFGTRLKYLEAGTTWDTTNGNLIPDIITPMHAYVPLLKSFENGIRVAKYTNGSGGATQVDFKLSIYTGTGTASFYSSISQAGIIAIRIH